VSGLSSARRAAGHAGGDGTHRRRSPALKRAQKQLDLPDSACFTDREKALRNTTVDLRTIVVPPAHHETFIDLAIANNMHILSEKPIADTMEASARIVAKVSAAGLKMGVTMSRRFDQDKQTLTESYSARLLIGGKPSEFRPEFVRNRPVRKFGRLRDSFRIRHPNDS
jgi:predicted dehydrogenase